GVRTCPLPVSGSRRFASATPTRCWPPGTCSTHRANAATSSTIPGWSTPSRRKHRFPGRRARPPLVCRRAGRRARCPALRALDEVVLLHHEPDEVANARRCDRLAVDDLRLVLELRGGVERGLLEERRARLDDEEVLDRAVLVDGEFDDHVTLEPDRGGLGRIYGGDVDDRQKLFLLRERGARRGEPAARDGHRKGAGRAEVQQQFLAQSEPFHRLTPHDGRNPAL